MRFPSLLVRAVALAGLVLTPTFPVSALAPAAAAEAAADNPRPALLFPPAPGLTDLAPDPALVLGELPNGVRYALRANPEPRGRASLRLVVAAGSLHENEDQRGLAHFLEHMAFNGTENYPAGTLVEYFQRLGMSFGGDTNAYTSFDRTVYKIELPDTRPETLAEGFRVLADFAGRLLLLPEEIERERGIILSEKLARDSADYRSAVASYHFFFAGTRLPERLPIGIEPVIRQAGREAFVDFFETWYRPGRIAIIAVGDLDAEAFREPLRAAFAPLEGRGPGRPTPDYGLPLAYAADPVAAQAAEDRSEPARAPVRFGHHHEAEASSTTVSFRVVRPADLSPDTSAKRLALLPRDLAFSILNRRLAELAKSEEAPFVRASVGDSSFPAVFDAVALSLTARPGKWAETLRAGEQELRRALLHGFQASELREAVAELRNALEQAQRTDPTRRSEDRTEQIVDAFIEGTIPTSPAADLALYSPALDALTPADLHAAFTEAWRSAGGRLVGIFGDTALGDREAALAAIAAVYAEAEALEVAPPAERADSAWAYEDFGPAGEIASREDIADLGVTRVVFSNGVRLNLKRTDFEAGTIGLRARVGTGQLTEPASQPGLAFFGGAAFTAGGLGKHSEDELRRILAGRNVGVGFNVGDDALVFSGQTTPADLVLQLQLLAAHLADPGYRPEAELTARRRMEPFYARLATDPSGPLSVEVPRMLASGDHRFGVPRREDAQARTLDELRAWLAPQLAAGPVELTLVGDLEVDAAIAAVAATLGALPEREPKPPLEDLRAVRVAPPGDHALGVTASVAKKVFSFHWPTTDARDIFRARRLAMLAEVFSDRLRKTVREELGGSYSPVAGSTPSDTYRDYGFILARVTLDPAEAERVRPAILAAAADLAANGVTEEELERARLPVLTRLRESERTNAYWLTTVLAASQEHPWRLDRARDRFADHAAITKADLDELASAYLSPARAILFTITAAPAQ
jgi:zinc protease